MSILRDFLKQATNKNKNVVFTDKCGIQAKVTGKKALEFPVYTFTTLGCNDKTHKADQSVFPNLTQIFDDQKDENVAHFHYSSINHHQNLYLEFCECFVSVRKTKPGLNDVVEVCIEGRDGRRETYNNDEKHRGHALCSYMHLFVDAQDYEKLDIKDFIKTFSQDVLDTRVDKQSLFEKAAHYPVLWNQNADKECFSIKKVDDEIQYFNPPKKVCYDKTVKTKSGEPFAPKQKAPEFNN